MGDYIKRKRWLSRGLLGLATNDWLDMKSIEIN
jgi:hypothetical protein